MWSIKEFLKISNDANTEKLANLTKFDLAWAPVQEESVTNPENSLTYPLSKTYFIDQTVDSQNILFGTDVIFTFTAKANYLRRESYLRLLGVLRK